MKKIINFLFPALFAALFASCVDDKKNELLPGDLMIDIATYVASNETGSVFTVQKDGDSPIATLTSDYIINDKMFPPKSRVLIQYVPESGVAYESGPVELYSVQAVNTTVKEGTETEYRGWNSDVVSVTSLWRTGNYINLWANIDVVSRPKTFELVLDTETIDTECPEYHIVFETDGVDARRHTIYGSYDISQVWNLETCNAVKVYYADANGTSSTIFYKNTLPIAPSN